MHEPHSPLFDMADVRPAKLDDEGGFIRFFKSLPAVGDDTIRIFDRGDWYTSHGQDAMFIAKTVSYPCCLSS